MISAMMRASISSSRSAEAMTATRDQAPGEIGRRRGVLDARLKIDGSACPEF